MNKLQQLLMPRNYLPNFLKIRTKNAELVPFSVKPAQNKLLKAVEWCIAHKKPIRFIILKARQMGFSTLVEALIFHDEVTNKLKNALIIAHEDSASQNLYTMYKTYYDNLPAELSPMQKIANSQEMLFENPTADIEEHRRNPGLQSKVKIATARNVNTARSNTYHNLHCSETAFWQDAKTLMTGMLQCVPDTANSMVFIESTANGVGGWFYDFYKAAENKDNEYTAMFFAWFEEPEYTREFDSLEEKEDFITRINYKYVDKNLTVIRTEEYEMLEQFPFLTYEQLNWRKYIIRNKCNNDVEQFHQEYPSTADEAFIASGRPRFSTAVLKKYRTKCTSGETGYFEWENGEMSTIRFVTDPKGYIEIWKHPAKDKFYCIGADVAEGVLEGDYSVGICGGEDFTIDAMWRGHIDPDLFGKELVKMAFYYNQAYLGVEANNHGLTTLKAIQNMEYWNIFFAKSYDKISDVITQKMGWTTTLKTKPLMIDKLAEFIREKCLGIKWMTLINECLTYVIEDNGSTNAQTGCNDDTVMATAIWLQLLLEGKGDNYKPETSDLSGKKQTEERAGFTLARDEEDADVEDGGIEISI